jgi:hypothetical protein
VEAALGLLEGPLGEQLQQLDQLLAPGACLPEHLQGLIEGPPLAAGAKELGREHQPLPHLALGEGLRIGRRGCGLLVGRQPAQFAPQGGEAGARGASEELTT